MSTISSYWDESRGEVVRINDNGSYADRYNINTPSRWEVLNEQSSSTLESEGAKTFGFMLVPVVILFLVSLVCAQRKKDSNNNGGNSGRNSRSSEEGVRDIEAALEIADSDENNNTSLALIIAGMNTEELMVLYSEAFDQNQKQAVVEPPTILTGESESNTNDTSDTSDTNEIDSDDEELKGEEGRCRRCDGVELILLSPQEARSIPPSTRLGTSIRSDLREIDDYDDTGIISRNSCNDDQSIYLALQEARSIRLSSRLGRSPHQQSIRSGFGEIDDYDDKGIISRNQSQLGKKSKSAHLPNAIKQHKRTHIHETGEICVICLEALKAGETVVWSETDSCPHVYHKECMVAFLAHKQKGEPQELQDNHPCPTCRQPFLTISTLVTI